MDELKRDWPPDFKDWLLDLVRLSLNSSFGRFGKSWYKSIIGIPTGGSLSVSLANIAVYYVLRSVIYNSPDKPDSLMALKRFVDDLTGLWVGSEEDFIIWSDQVNERLGDFGLSIKDSPDIKWDFKKSGEYTTFLDINYSFDLSSGLITDVNIKKTDARTFLHFSSYHPRQTFKSIVYSQCLRYRRIINEHIRLVRRLDELGKCFINSGYPKKMVSGIIDDVVTRKRSLDYIEKSDEPPFPIVWVQTYGPATSHIKELISDANVAAKLSPVWKDVSKPIGVVNRRSKNLGDILLQRKKFALQDVASPTGTTRCTPTSTQGDKNPVGRPCQACDLMSNNKYVTSTTTGETYKLPNGTCKSKGLIYLAQCVICQLQYTGKTSNKLQTRISGHRTHVGRLKTIPEDKEGEEESDEMVLAEHLFNVHGLNTVRAFNESYKFSILQLNPKNLERCEQMWANKLLTIQPFGLNKEKPCGVAESLLDMSQRSLSQRM